MNDLPLHHSPGPWVHLCFVRAWDVGLYVSVEEPGAGQGG